MQILIIDSSLQVAIRIEEIISGPDYLKGIYKAETYRSGIMQYHAYNPEVVMLDSCLPFNMSFELLKAIKATNSKTHVIVLSSNPGACKDVCCLALGADHCVDKYYDFKKLPSIVKNIAKQNINSKTLN